MYKTSKVIIFIGLLILVRAFAQTLFYDPFIPFFKRFLSDATFPEFKLLPLVISVFFRYLLNATLSIALLYVVFKSKPIIKFSVFFYGIAFIILLFFFVVLLLNLSEGNFKTFFYVRRFLIHPIFLLLLLPAFYYQNLNKNG